MPASEQTEEISWAEEIRALVAMRTGRKLEQVHWETRLVADLGLDGPMAEAFMREFAARYALDLRDMSYPRYFHENPMSAGGGSSWGAGFDVVTPVVVAIASFFSPEGFARRWRAAKEAEREVTVAHLVKVAEAGLWLDPTKKREADRTEGSVSELLFAAAGSLLIFSLPVIYAISPWRSGAWAILVGVMLSLVYPIMVLAAWRAIERKLDSAANTGGGPPEEL